MDRLAPEARQLVLTWFEDLLSANTEYAEAFDKGHLMPLPYKQLAVVTCMDCRIDTASVFGLDPGDAHVMRNAGARVTSDVLRSLIISTNKMGVARIAIVHHTHCGAAATTHDDLLNTVQENTGNIPDSYDFHLFTDTQEALLEDVSLVLSCPYIPKDTAVAGFFYDVEIGLLRPATADIHQ